MTESPAERRVLLALVIAAVVLRVLLIAFSPAPFGYVWDFYFEGVRHVSRTGHLPSAADCWQCYHPPLFYVLGWPMYEVGRRVGHDPPGVDAAGLRALSLLATIAAAVLTFHGYRLLRLFRCRGQSLVAGVALLLTFPSLFISSYGAEADIVVSALLSAFLFYLARDWRRDGSVWPTLRLGVLAGLAAATKYSGLVAFVSAAAVVAMRAWTRAEWRAALIRIGVLTATCCALAGWSYVENYRRYGTPFFANGSALQGFTLANRRDHRDQYEFTTFRIRELMRLTGPRPPRGALTDLPVYRSVPTTVHALAWSDMTFFSEPGRHGDPSRPYPQKRIPRMVTRTVLILGFVPELLVAIGVVTTLRRASFRPVAVMCTVSVAAYVWWFTSQPQWGLKTKYLLFLLPAFVLYAVCGLAWLRRRMPIAAIVANVLLAALIVVTHVYLAAFAIG